VLSQLIAVSVEYKALICLGNGCRRAIRLAGFLRHIYNQEHPITKEQRQQAQEYIARFLYNYSYSTIELPIDGLALQPIIPVVDGFQCRKCLEHIHLDLNHPFRS
jgi:hypothetical protein